MNHSQNRFVKNNPISSHERVTGFVCKGEGWALVMLWMLSHVACSEARWRDMTGYLMSPKYLKKTVQSSQQFFGLFEVEQGPTLDLVLCEVFIADSDYELESI